MNPIKIGILTALLAAAANANPTAGDVSQCLGCDPVALQKEQDRHAKALEGLRARAERLKRTQVRKKYLDQIKALRAQMEASTK